MADPKLGAGLASGGLSELKRRLLFVLLGIIVFRLGAHIPVPGLDPAALARLFSQHEGGLLGLFNMFSGGALRNMTIFALSIMPYISASIIIQMYSSISPRLMELKKEGEAGRRKINQYTRYGTLILSFVQAIGVSKWLASSGVALSVGFGFYFVAVVTLVTGTMFLMWLGEQMTEHGVGNGISMIIFAGIVARFPASIAQIFTQVRQGQIPGLNLLILIAMIVLIALVVVYFERAQRRIRIEYAKRQQGRKLYAAQASHLPLKINMAGVIPPIFAQSIILVPGFLSRSLGTTPGFTWLNAIALNLEPTRLVYMLVYGSLVVFFAFFYAALTFDPKETADNLKKSGAFVPGIRPGEQTARYVDGVMTRLTLVGALYLVVVCLFPNFLYLGLNIPLSVGLAFGGTALLIVVVVVMDFMSQVQAHLMSHQYESIMKKSKGGKIGLIR